MKNALLLAFTLGLILISLGKSFSTFWRRPSGRIAQPGSRGVRMAARRQSSRLPADSPWRQQSGESEFAYMKRLQQMASSTQDLVIQNTTATTAVDGEKSDPPKKLSGYTRVEEWNEKKYKKTNLTWEERVQWEGQQHGDKFMQNEILRKNINYFG